MTDRSSLLCPDKINDLFIHHITSPSSYNAILACQVLFFLVFVVYGRDANYFKKKKYFEYSRYYIDLFFLQYGLKCL